MNITANFILHVMRAPKRGWGGVLPYISYVCAASSGRAFAPFWSEHEYTLCLFWSRIGYGFRRNYGSVRECRLNSK